MQEEKIKFSSILYSALFYSNAVIMKQRRRTSSLGQAHGEPVQIALRCRTNTCGHRLSNVPVCQICESCVLGKKRAITKEWFLRASEVSKRKFLFGIIRKMHSLDLLVYIEKILQPLLGKDFIYSRSRINPSLPEDTSTTSSDRALNQKLLLQFMTETWEWFKGGSYWTKANYTLLLLQMCSPPILHNAANLIRILIVQGTQSHLFKEGPYGPQNEKFIYGMKDPDSSSKSLTIDPSLMVAPTSFEATSGISMHKDFIRCLPVHLSKMILGFLDKKSLSSCLSVSRHWCYLVKDLRQDLKAERLVQNDAMILQGTSYKGVSVSYAKMQKIPVPKIGEAGNVILQRDKSWIHELKPGKSLEAAYIDNETESVLMEERNIYCGSYNVLTLTRQGDPHSVIHFDGGRYVAVGSADRKVKLFDTSEMKQVPPLCKGHAGSIQVVHLCEERGFVFSGSFDASIRQWNLQSGVCMRIYRGHMKTIKCLDVHDNFLVSGSKDSHVKVWNISSGKCLRTFKHKDAISSVKLKEQYVVSGCEKGFVKLWHVESGILIKTLSGHQGPIKSLSFDQWHLLSGGADGNAIAWSMMGTFKKRLMTFRHPMEVMCLEFLYLRVITGCADGKIRVFNFLNGDCLRVMRANSRADPVVSLHIKDNRMVINVLTSIMLFQFEEISWNYSQASERVDALKDRVRFKSAPIRTQPHSYVRAQRMRHSGSSNRKVYQREEVEEGKTRLSHHVRSLSARSMKRAQDAHLQSLELTTRPEFLKKSPANRPQSTMPSNLDVFSRASQATEMKTRDDSDNMKNTIGISPSAHSPKYFEIPTEGDSRPHTDRCKNPAGQKFEISDYPKQDCIQKRGPHSPMSPNQILLKASNIQNLQTSNVLGSNLVNNANIRDTWGLPMSHSEQKREVPHHPSTEHTNKDPVKYLQDLKNSAVPAEVKTFMTPFEIRKLKLKMIESLHGSEVRSSIPSPTIIRPKTNSSFWETMRNPAKFRRSATAESSQQQLRTSCELIQPLRMIMGQSNKTPDIINRPQEVVKANPFREKCGFLIRTVTQQKEYEAEKMSLYNKTQAHVQANKNKESKNAWLMKIKGKNIEKFTTEGKIAAPEFGHNVFL
ncbi:LOW QUALITY PROTEIN: F-box and WD repeat domain containing protein 10B-like [Pelodytes ibericus]